MKEQAARIKKRTSGRVFVAVDSNLGAVVGEKEGAVVSIPGNEGRVVQVWVNARGGMRMFAAYPPTEYLCRINSGKKKL